LDRPTALIAHDSPEWCSVISHMLSSHYDVVGSISDGDEVLASASALQPDFLTLDVTMPGTSGLNLLPKLRALVPAATIVIVTTHSSDLYVKEAYQRGADGYVLKANAWQDLLPALQNGRTVREALVRA
jgi:DNA-binding NarL/FixJ family response regulator